MWVSKRKWAEMESRLSCLEGFAKERAIRAGFHETTSYANNEMCWKEIRICVSARDWYLLQREPFFQELVQYGRDLNKRTQESM